MAKNKIFIDGLGLVEGHFSGVGQYILGIIKGIDEILDEQKYNGQEVPAVIVIIPYNTAARFREFGFKHVAYKRFPLSFRTMSALWHRGKLPPIDLWCGKGTYIFPRFVDMPLLFSKSAALVVFDLSYELFRQYSDEGNARFLSVGVRNSIARTDKVITISKSAKKELVDFYNLPSNRVLISTPATDPHLFYRRDTKEVEAVKQKYGISGNYILALSNLEPRKNLESLVEAYCDLPAEVRKDLSLLLVGVSGWKTEELFNTILSRVESGFNIIRPSHYVSDEDKPAIISGASMLVYPSHYEGFGMPPLEALACGVPVITADNSSLPEVVEHAGKMVSSNDQKGLNEAIRSYCKNIKSVGNAAIVNGPAQAAKFSWKESAQVFLDVAMGKKS